MGITTQDALHFFGRDCQHPGDECLVNSADLWMILPDLQVGAGDLVDAILLAGLFPFDVEALFSQDGKSWKPYCSFEIKLASKLFAGLGATSHNPVETVKAVFSELVIN